MRGKIHNFTAPHGLPDPNDSSKLKDFYYVHLWNYCSGTFQNGHRDPDFCSQPTQFIFDIVGNWKSLGTGVQNHDLDLYWLENGPKALYIMYIGSVSLKALEILSIGALRWRWGIHIVRFLSWVSSRNSDCIFCQTN